MTYELVFVHEPPINGRRVCHSYIGGVSSREEAEAEARKVWPGIVQFKQVAVRVRHNKPGERPREVKPVRLPDDLTDRILASSRKPTR